MRLPICVVALVCCLTVNTQGRAADRPTSAWARPGADGKLVYQADERGNTIPDFSRAGKPCHPVKVSGGFRKSNCEARNGK